MFAETKNRKKNFTPVSDLNEINLVDDISSDQEMILSAIIGWGSMYFFLKKGMGGGDEWTMRIITSIHATVITFLSFLDWLYINKWDIDRFGEQNSRFEEAILSLTLGYFVVDLLWILSHESEGKTMYLHHISSIICLFYIIFSETSATEVIVGISGLEVTNPCLQLRWFLRFYGYQGTLIHTTTEIIFMVSFIIFRIYYGSYLTYIILHQPKSPFILKAGAVSLYCISWVFVYQMFKYVYKKYVRGDNSKPACKTD